MTFSDFIKKLKAKSDQILLTWFYKYLKQIDYSPSIPGFQDEIPLVIKRIYYESQDPDFQRRVGIVISSLLESYEPVKNTEEYLFYLLTIIPIIRPPEAKNSLRKLLFEKALDDDFRFDIFNLKSQLIIALCEYDIDQTLKDHINRELPGQKNFKDYALTCYRGLMHLYDESPFILIPKLAKFWDDDAFYKKFIYLFKLSIERIGINTFANVYLTIINELKSFDNNLSIRFNRFLQKEILNEYSNLSSKNYIKLLFQVYSELNEKNPINLLIDDISKQNIFRAHPSGVLVQVGNKSANLDLETAEYIYLQLLKERI